MASELEGTTETSRSVTRAATWGVVDSGHCNHLWRRPVASVECQGCSAERGVSSMLRECSHVNNKSGKGFMRTVLAGEMLTADGKFVFVVTTTSAIGSEWRATS